MKLLTSIKGISVTLAAALIVATGVFSYFANAKNLLVILACCSLTNNPERLSMSKVTSTSTEIHICEAGFM